MKNICIALAVSAILVACNQPDDNAVVKKEEQGNSASVEEKIDTKVDLGKPDEMVVPVVDDDIENETVGDDGGEEPVGESDESEPVAVSTEDRYVGVYDGEMEFPQEMLDMIRSFAEAAGEDPDDAIAKMLSPKMTMELKKDGVCTLVDSTGGASDSIDGTWSLSEDGTQITIVIEDAASANPMQGDEDMVFVISDDGKVLTFKQEEMGMKFKMTFTRQ